MADFPVGTYTRCAQGEHNPSGNQFLNEAGFQEGAGLTVTRSGTNVVLVYIDQNGLTRSLVLAPKTHAVASIVEHGQVIPGFRSMCVLGPGREAPYPASMTVTAGLLTFDGGTMFLTLTGDLASKAGKCGTLSQTQASFWLACGDEQGGASRSAETSSGVGVRVEQLSAGEYSCSTQVESRYAVNGRTQYAAGGATGKLGVARDGATVTVKYSGDSSLTGSLRFTRTSPITASLAGEQIVSAACMGEVGEGQGPGASRELRITSAALSVVDSMVFLSFTGSMGDGSLCPGATLAGSLICSKK